MKKVIDFIGLRWVFITLSIVLIGAGLAGFLINRGFNYSIDFRPGLNQQFRIAPAAARADIAGVRSTLAPLGRYDLQEVGAAAQQEFVVKVLAEKADSDFQLRTEARILELLEGAYGVGSVTIKASDFVGPRYAQELATQTVWILLVAIILILIYAAARFKFIYGMAAVLCLVHDALFMLAVVAVFRIEFSTTTVAAILTIIGYSINDTIVIFDRVREDRTLMPNTDLKTLLNTAISQTLGRSILTSVTTFLAVIALYVLGTGDIKNFALLMLVGIAEAAYSTIFIASPIVYMWSKSRERRRRAHDLAKYGHVREAGTAPAHERKAAAEAAEAAAGEAAAEAGEEAYETEPQAAASPVPGVLPSSSIPVPGTVPGTPGAAAPTTGAVPAAAVPEAGTGQPGSDTRVPPVRRHKKRKR